MAASYTPAAQNKLKYELCEEQFPHFYPMGYIKSNQIEKLKSLPAVTHDQIETARKTIYSMISRHTTTLGTHRAKYEICYVRAPLLEVENLYPPTASNRYVYYAERPYIAERATAGGIKTSVTVSNPGDAIKLVQALDAHELILHISTATPPGLSLMKCNTNRYMALYDEIEECSCGDYDTIMIPMPNSCT